MTPSPDAPTEPSEEALEAEWFAWLCLKYVQRADERQRQMGLQYTEAETHDLAAEISRRVLSDIDRFRAAGVREERDRCFKWAIGRRLRSRAAQAIRDGEDPSGHPLDPSLCWRCGATLYPGHDCSGASP